MSLRLKLLLVALSTLTLPWAGWQFVRQTEALLRQGQEQTLLASASTLARALVALDVEVPAAEDILYVHARTDTLRIDTNTDGNFPADANGVIPIELVGGSLVSTSVIKVTLSDGNNNCGGVAVGENFVCGGELTVTNDGGTNLVFTPRVVEGTGDFDLGSANGVQQTLPSGASMQLPVTFRPSKRGLLPGLVRLTKSLALEAARVRVADQIGRAHV